MNTFNYNSPIMKMLETIANMLIVSFFWLVCCIPVITIVPACTALYHTTVKVIFGAKHGKGVMKNFFHIFTSSFKQGWILSLIVVAACFFAYTGIDTGLQIWNKGIIGAAYMAIGVFVVLMIFPTVLYIAPVLSRFEADNLNILRISLYISFGNILLNLEFMILLFFMYISISFFPLLLLIVPALYTDLIRPQMERKLTEFIQLNHLEEEQEEVQQEEEEQEDISMADLSQSLSQKRKKEK